MTESADHGTGNSSRTPPTVSWRIAAIDHPRRMRDSGRRSLRSQSIQCLIQRNIEVPPR